MNRKISSAILLLFVCVNVAVSQSYRIKVQIDGAKDSLVLLAMYNGNNKYVRDSARTDNKGVAVFSKDQPLIGGMYLLALGNRSLCDFLISDDKSQNFEIICKRNGTKEEITYKNSPENTALIDFQKKMGEWQSARRRIHEYAMKDTSFIPTAKDSLEIIAKKEKEYTDKVAQQWKGKLLSSLAKAVQPSPQMPELDLPDNTPGRDSILWAHYYQWEKNHFFDNIDFSDGRLLNTPVFQSQFDYYFSKKIMQHPDSLISAIAPVLARAKADKNMFMFCLGHLFNTYIQSKTLTVTSDNAIGFEAVVVFLIKNYYLAGATDWVTDTTFIRQIREYVHDNEPSLVGKKAHDLLMETPAGQMVSLNSLPSNYTLLVFFDTDCGHCKKEMPQIHEVYEKYRNKGFEVYCVYIKGDGPEWVKFVQEQKLDWINVWDPYNKTNYRNYYNVATTPQMYLLNKDKTIIARHVTADLLSQLLGLYIDKKAITSTPSSAVSED